MYFSIGFDGSVLPTGRIKFTNNKKNISLLDIQNKVLRAIYTVLDVYFDVKRKEWNDLDLQNFRNKLVICMYIICWCGI